MTRSYIDENIDSFLRRNDSDSFHNLIDCGEDALVSIDARIAADRSLDTTTRLLDVLQEIRTKDSEAIILEILKSQNLKTWSRALDAFCYFHGNLAVTRLRDLLRSEKDVARSAKINEIIADLT